MSSFGSSTLSQARTVPFGLDVRVKLLGKYGKRRINSHPVALFDEPLSLVLEAQLEETRPFSMTACCSHSIARFVTLTSGEADQASRISTLKRDASS